MANYYYEAYHNRSMVYNSLEEYDKALADINRAIDLNATDDPLYYARGMIHENMKNIDQALSDYDSGLINNNPIVFFLCKYTHIQTSGNK